MNQRELPIYQVEQELLVALQKSRVVVVEGSTGSGKTTQIPRIINQAFGPACIGVTQPRRIAAVSVAWRIAQLDNVELGQQVGYKIRFDDQTGPQTNIKIMTDGILLNEARTDPLLKQYDFIMVDEAHERSLNIDISLGLLFQILQKRQDLRVIVSSATLQPEMFQRFFNPVVGNVPCVSVRSQLYPLQYHYDDDVSHDDMAYTIAEHIQAIHHSGQPGHVLVFLSGIGAISDVQAAIDDVMSWEKSNLQILPLYASLTRQEQERVFDEFGQKRKIILATNIAETSITIPNIRFVIDSGLVKVPRYSPKTGVTSLQEEPVSQASAKQRAGRAGRTGPGKVFRLYSKELFTIKPEMADEEVTRLELSEVVLRLIDLGFKSVEDFPLPTALPRGKINAALETLTLLGAIDPQRQLTTIGKKMVAFPLTPHLSRMVIEAQSRFPNVVYEVLVVAACLSGRSPFVMSEPNRSIARKAQKRFHHKTGDMLTLLIVYNEWSKATNKRQFCQRFYIDSEVMDFTNKAFEQLQQIAVEQGITIGKGGKADHIIQACAAGFADKIIRFTKSKGYMTLANTLVTIHPGSVLFGHKYDFVVAAELMRYNKTYAMNVSVIESRWIATISPQAANLLGFGKNRKEQLVIPLNTQIEIAGRTFSIGLKKGRGLLDISLEDVIFFKQQDNIHIDNEYAKVKVRVSWGNLATFSSVPLQKFFKHLDDIPYPLPSDQPVADVRFNDLLESDRDLYAIEKILDYILRPSIQGAHAGWIVLVTNGAGGYWLDLVMRYNDAVITSQTSLECLRAELHEEDPLISIIEHKLDLM